MGALVCGVHLFWRELQRARRERARQRRPTPCCCCRAGRGRSAGGWCAVRGPVLLLLLLLLLERVLPAVQQRHA